MINSISLPLTVANELHKKKRGMSQRTVHTVDDYTNEINTIFNGSLQAKVKDLYVIADFTAFFESSIDPHFAAYCKEEDTQHQFKFDAVEVNTDFPLGVRTMYRAYCSDKVIEFVKKPKEQCLSPIGQRNGLEPHTLLVSWGPERQSTLTPDKKALGFYILQKIPYCDPGKTILPKEFEKNSLASFAKTVREAKSKFTDRAEIVEAWERWEKKIISGVEDWTAAQYATEKPLLYQVPLKEYFRLEPHEVLNQDWAPANPTFTDEKDSGFKWPELNMPVYS